MNAPATARQLHTNPAATNVTDPLAEALAPDADVPVRAITGRDQAIIFFDDLEATITQLLDLLDTETELMRAGRIDESLALNAKKTALATTYGRRIQILKANVDILGRLVPVEIDKLRQRREAMEATLKTNIAVLSAARAVSDALVKGVADEVARKAGGPSVYGNNGAKPESRPRAAPIVVDRAM